MHPVPGGHAHDHGQFQGRRGSAGLADSVTLAGKRCFVTGASSGIGRAVALALAGAGGQVWAVGRSPEQLESLRIEANDGSGAIFPLVADLEVDRGLEAASREILSSGEYLDVLVHSAGAIARGPVWSAGDDDLDRQYRLNLRAPFVLTRTLLPALKQARGQVVFVNSSAGLATSAPDAALYAATKHGLRAFADSLRQEVNAHGVRVLTIYPGRTATPMQESVHAHEGRPYRPEALMRPNDVATMVLAALAIGPTAEVTDISIRPMSKLPDA
jgi:short-subunit dehydrogenase